jgi:hypothetical protein
VLARQRFIEGGFKPPPIKITSKNSKDPLQKNRKPGLHPKTTQINHYKIFEIP